MIQIRLAQFSTKKKLGPTDLVVQPKDVVVDGGLLDFDGGLDGAEHVQHGGTGGVYWVSFFVLFTEFPKAFFFFKFCLIVSSARPLPADEDDGVEVARPHRVTFRRRRNQPTIPKK